MRCVYIYLTYSSISRTVWIVRLHVQGNPGKIGIRITMIRKDRRSVERRPPEKRGNRFNCQAHCPRVEGRGSSCRHEPKMGSQDVYKVTAYRDNISLANYMSLRLRQTVSGRPSSHSCQSLACLTVDKHGFIVSHIPPETSVI